MSGSPTGTTHRVESPRRSSRALAAGVTCAVLATIGGTGYLVLQSSQAAFVSTASANPLNFQAGTVVLGDDGAGSLYTNLAGLTPGSTATTCIKVNYTGSASANVKLYATVTGNTGLGTYLTFTVDQGTAGPNASRTCSTAPAFGGTVTNLATSVPATSLPTSYSGGYTCWAAATGDSRWYRISYTMDPATPDSQQGAGVDVTLSWQAQNV